MSNEVTIKCHWCGGEFKMPKKELEGTMDTGIQVCFDQPFAVYSGKKQITGEVIIKVSPIECDLCEYCSLVLAQGAVGDMMIDRDINPEDGVRYPQYKNMR